MQDQKLIQSCLRGDVEAEKQLFFRFAPKVLTLCRRYVARESVARDLIQDCFVLVFEKLPTYDAERGDFGAWLYRLSSNVALQYLRKEKRGLPLVFPEHLPEEVTDKSEGDLLDKIDDDTLLQAIRQLPEGYRTVLNLYVFDNYKHHEISELLGISEGTSRSQYARAKTMLKTLLQKKISGEFLPQK